MLTLDPKNCFDHEKKMSDYLIKKLSLIDDVKMYLPRHLDKHIGIISFCVKNFNSDDIGIILDEDFDIAVRTGYHCAPYIHKYLEDQENLGTVRIGLSQYTTYEEMNQFLEAVKEIVYE